MNIGIIGAGFTGLGAGVALSRKGHHVTIFEKDTSPGGLAIGYKEKGWDWSLEKHYHHWFTNDYAVLRLAQQINYPVCITRPKTSVFVDGTMYQLDSPKHVLLFPKLTLTQRIRMASVLALLRYNPFWKPLEGMTTVSFLKRTMGEKPYQLLWEPQLKNKFGSYLDTISLAWFWARIKKRTADLAYPQEGFLEFANKLCTYIQQKGGTLLFQTETTQITSNKTVTIKARSENKNKHYQFDKIIVTLPSFLFCTIAPQLPPSYKEKLGKLKGLGAINLILRLKTQFLTDNTYWLSICDTTAPVMAIVEHTNFMDKKHYNNEHLVYLGNYLPFSDQRFRMAKEELLPLLDPFLQTIHPGYDKMLIGYHVWKAPFAQPIIPTNYSKLLPPVETPLKNVYLANIEQVYPWDRGTNYAVELGEKVAKRIIENHEL